MKKTIATVIIAICSSSFFLHKAVHPLKKPGGRVTGKQPDAGDKNFIHTEYTTGETVDYLYVYGAGLPAMCNYF